MSKIILKIEMESRGIYPVGFASVQWKRSLPFFANPRGLLVHRVRSAQTHMRNGEQSHNSVKYLCGNSCCFDNADGLCDDPPANRLLCESCEYIAKRLGLPSADQLAGRHIHVGKIRVEQTCCLEEKGRN